MNKKTIASTLLALSLTVACADESDPETNNTSEREQAMRSADATGKMLALSNAVVGIHQLGQRSNFAEDIGGDIATGIEEFLASLENPACLTHTVDVVNETQVELAFDFSDCETDSGLENIDGTLSFSINADDEATIDCVFDGDLQVDGYDLDGDWTIGIGALGTASITGQIGIVLPDGTDLSVVLDAQWKDVGGLCPSLSQNLDITSNGEALSIDLTGLDVCSGSLCESEVDVLIEGTEGLDPVDFDDYGPDVEGAGLVCGDDGDFEDSP